MEITSIQGNIINFISDDGETAQWYADEKGLIIGYGNDPDVTEPDFPLNSYVGQKWYDREVTLEVISVNKTITVSAGTFTNCVEIIQYFSSNNRKDILMTAYYSYKYGMIMHKWENDDFTTTLISKNF